MSSQDISVVRPNHDLTAQLTHRRERLSFLIKFINDNGVLTKVKQIYALVRTSPDIRNADESTESTTPLDGCGEALRRVSSVGKA